MHWIPINWMNSWSARTGLGSRKESRREISYSTECIWYLPAERTSSLRAIPYREIPIPHRPNVLHRNTITIFAPYATSNPSNEQRAGAIDSCGIGRMIYHSTIHLRSECHRHAPLPRFLVNSICFISFSMPFPLIHAALCASSAMRYIANA